MRIAETVTFAGGHLDRAEDLRRDPDALAALPARVLPLWRGKPLVDAGRTGLGLVEAGVIEAMAGPGPAVLICRDGEGAVFARDVSGLAVEGGEAQAGFADDTEQTHPGLPAGTAFCELRRVMTALDRDAAEIAATARGVLDWHRTHGFCANCGAPTEIAKAGWMRGCGACGRMHFPRTDPVVIMLVTRGERILVGRAPGWPEGMFSCLAGFMEPGETLEAAVRREVWEETGVRVGAVGYLASQPWPFPASLMLGARGEALTDDIEVDPQEIEEALWLDREELAQVFDGSHPRVRRPRDGAIAGFMMRAWLADRLD